jgi:hypothetical protein
MTDQNRPVSERRRPRWREFRRAYPGFTFTMTLGVLVLLALNAFALYKRNDYDRETARLRQDMTASEKQRADLIIQDEQNKVAIAIELARRQARLDKQLHLSVQTDSGRMYLEREGAILREMIVQIGPEYEPKRMAGGSQDSVPIAIPRGERTVVSFTDGGGGNGGGSPTIQLDGGTVIYSVNASDSAAVAAPVKPGQVRANAADLKAIRENLSTGMKVYFF